MTLADNTLNFAEITAFYHVELNHFDMGMHHHQECEIMYVTKGSCIVATRNDQLQLHSGEFVFLESDEPHQLILPKGKSCTLMNIEFSVTEAGPIPLQQLRSALPQLAQPQKPVVITDQQELGRVLADLIKKLNLFYKEPTTDAATSLSIQLLFQRLIIELGQNFAGESQQLRQPYVQKATQYIRQHLLDELTIPSIAAEVGLNRSYLQTLFKQQTGESIIQYIKRLRMEQACFLLVNSSLGVTEIAFEVGFNNRQHFGKTFTTTIGMSPKAFRQQKLRKFSYETGEEKGQHRKEQDWGLLPWRES